MKLSYLVDNNKLLFYWLFSPTFYNNKYKCAIIKHAIYKFNYMLTKFFVFKHV
jgi:hypothetical protein